MKDTIVFEMSRERAKQLGLLVCKTCGYPENNHFGWGTKPSAHDSSCKAYNETSIRDVELKT